MVKLELLSPNLITIIKQIITNKNLCKYLYYNVENPLGQLDIADTSTLILSKIFPYPFNPQVVTEDVSQLMIYYPRANIEDIVVEDINVNFDIIVAKNLWLINDGTNSQIRPYLIAQEIVNIFNKKSIGTIGKLKFKHLQHLTVDDKFDAVQLVANMEEFSKQ